MNNVPGAVPVINYSDDDDIEELTKNNARDMGADHEEDYEDEQEDRRDYQKRVESDLNFENLFSNGRKNYHKENDDSGSSRNSVVENHSNVENEFKILMYLEEKNEMTDENPLRELVNNKDKAVHVEKKLDYLFRREVPLNNIYFDKEGEQTPSIIKPAASEITSNFFQTDMGNILFIYRT